jgi:hypothetical protein|tara:strand:+ start:2163 stop:2354 length:192 start_codon:yes stop_codon:yes gene_type:complete
MYLKAIYLTLLSMTPFYINNFCKWVKMATWDAPLRIMLDIELQAMKLERDLSREDSNENVKND